ncbi:MAG TPA: DEAD/DEAH box helicase [Acidobacteriota bacterium]|nr:DEAD/DEAH box helicase [Acidobacteriota bacterium]
MTQSHYTDYQIWRKPWKDRLTLYKLSEIGCKLSKEAEALGYILVRPSVRKSSSTIPGLWVAPTDKPLLDELVAEIQAQASAKQSKKDRLFPNPPAVLVGRAPHVQVFSPPPPSPSQNLEHQRATLAAQRIAEKRQNLINERGFSGLSCRNDELVCSFSVSLQEFLGVEKHIQVELTAKIESDEQFFEKFDQLVKPLLRRKERMLKEVPESMAKVMALIEPSDGIDHPGQFVAQAIESTHQGIHGFAHRWKQAVALHLRCRRRLIAPHLKAEQRQHQFAEFSQLMGDYLGGFVKARMMKRTITFFAGPANSGKTYAALNYLAEAASGEYLAPLRLMALEGRDALLERGIPAHLLTGEEEEWCEDARHVACTIERASFGEVMECAVIDEVQMLKDPGRGAAWTAAICGIPARHVLCVGSPSAIEAVRLLAAKTGDDFEVRHFDRFQSLTIQKHPVKLSELSPGDALICFSRRDVMDFKALLEESKLEPAVVYGNLSPSVRREQARRFRSGEAPVLIATDAIGMGLNLPIRRVIFTAIGKFDGQRWRELYPEEVQQIAGRAGRYGLHETGVVAGLQPAQVKALTRLLPQVASPVRPPFGCAPGLDHILFLSQRLGIKALARLYREFGSGFRYLDQDFQVKNLESEFGLAYAVDRHSKQLSLAERYYLSLAPIDVQDHFQMRCFSQWVGQIANRQAVPLRVEVSDTLESLEAYSRLLVAYAWLARHYPELCESEGVIQARSVSTSVRINELLRQKTPRRRCRECAQVLPIGHRYRLCEPCFQAQREDWYFDDY